MSKFMGGQEVIVTGHAGPITLQVKMVGRKYVYASRLTDSVQSQWRRFRLVDGVEDNYIGGGGRIWTLEEWDELSARSEVLAELKTLGWSNDGWLRGKASTDQLRRIVAILKEE